MATALTYEPETSFTVFRDAEARRKSAHTDGVFFSRGIERDNDEDPYDIGIEPPGGFSPSVRPYVADARALQKARLDDALKGPFAEAPADSSKITFSRSARPNETENQYGLERDAPENRYERIEMKWEDDMRAWKPSSYPTPEERRASLDALLDKTILFNLPDQGLSEFHKELVFRAEQALRITNALEELKNKPAAPPKRRLRREWE